MAQYDEEEEEGDELLKLDKVTRIGELPEFLVSRHSLIRWAAGRKMREFREG